MSSYRGTLVGLSNLRRMYLNHNKLKHIDKLAFLDLKEIKFAYLDGNKLSNFNNIVTPLNSYQNLEILSLSNNKINNFFQEWRMDDSITDFKIQFFY